MANDNKINPAHNINHENGNLAARSYRVFGMFIDGVFVNCLCFVIPFMIPNITTEQIFKSWKYWCIFVLYGIFMEYRFQATLGKFICKTRVRGVNGEIPTLQQVVIRNVSRLIPFDAISIAFGTDKIFHDLLANTKVIKIRN